MSLAVLRYEARHRIRGALGVSAAFSLMGLLFLALAPQIVAGGQVQGLADALPPQFRAAFGLQSLASVEGLLAGEYYTLFWGLFFGIYLAHSAAGSVAGDVESHRMDTLLATPIPRSRVLVEKFLSLLVPVLVASLVVPVVLYAGSVLVDDPVSLADLAALHLLSIPYLLLLYRDRTDLLGGYSTGPRPHATPRSARCSDSTSSNRSSSAPTSRGSATSRRWRTSTRTRYW